MDFLLQKNPWFIVLQKFLLTRQKQLNRWLFVAEICLVIVWALAFFVLLVQPSSISLLLPFGRKFGTAAALLFTLSLLPGIITRSKVMPGLTLPISTLITPFRRHIGILMFITAFVHMSFSSNLPYLAGQLAQLHPVQALTISQKLTYLMSVFPPRYQLYEIMGLIAWLLLMPVWLISNDKSMQAMGKWWKRMQRLTYISIWFIFLHVAFQAKNIAPLIFLVAVAEVYSWIAFWRRKPAQVQ